MKTALTVLFVLFLCVPAAVQDLPPDILADQYLLEATKALENGDPQGALQAFGKIEALDTEPPLEFLFFYGKLLVENRASLDDLLKGQSLLKQFVLSIEKDSEHYTPTLELLSVVGTKLEKAEHPYSPLLEKQMVHVQGGTFTMGCTPEQKQRWCDDDEEPAHRVRVSSFEISKYEVTQELWEAVMGENPSRFQDCPQCPVEQVSWNDVQIFLKNVDQETGVQYRLPTEVEWEYAARGGSQSRGYRYAGSNNPGSVAWYEDNSGDETHPVGQKQPNELGLYDMSGNVSEWVQDWYDEEYYSSSPVDNPSGPSTGARRVERGGSSFDGAYHCRAAARYGYSQGNRDRYRGRGFRLARTP